MPRAILSVLATLGVLWHLGTGTPGHAGGVAPGGSAAELSRRSGFSC
jgi:hypothetical protein